jgi:hypothetical protein
MLASKWPIGSSNKRNPNKRGWGGMNNRVRKTQSQFIIVCFGLIIFLAGCIPAGTALPAIEKTLTATTTKTPTAQPSQTPTYTVEPTQPYGITVERIGKLDKQPSKTIVDWSSSLEELDAGEYIITRTVCPEGGDCRQINAYSLADSRNTVLARFNKPNGWPAVLFQDRLYFGVGEKYSSIQVIDFRNREDYSLRLGAEYEFMGGGRWTALSIYIVGSRSSFSKAIYLHSGLFCDSCERNKLHLYRS